MSINTTRLTNTPYSIEIKRVQILENVKGNGPDLRGPKGKKTASKSRRLSKTEVMNET